MAQNYGLGRGLSSLIPQKSKKIEKPEEDFNYFGSGPFSQEKNLVNPTEKENEISTNNLNSIQEIPISEIYPNPFQPRLNFDEAKLQELSNSIKEHGIIQPIVVTKKEKGYEIIAGERRFQAAKLAEKKTVPVIIREGSDQQKLELAIVENVQRENLDSIEEAKSYLKLIEEFSLTQEEVAKKMGKSRSVVANKIRLLQLPIEIQKALVLGKISEGHCKLLLAIPNLEKQRAFFEMIIRNSLTVRQTEEKSKEISVKKHKRTVVIDPQVKNLENEISEVLGTKVKIKKSGGGGSIVIDYYSQEELDNILSKIK